jgi:thiamine biosynthesis lipoprotein
MNRAKSSKKAFLCLLTAALLIATATACSAPAASGGAEREAPFTRTRAELLGTVITISVFDEAPSDEALEALLDRCFLEIEGVEARMSVNRADSEIAAVNAAPGGGEYLEISEELYRLVARAKSISERSDGAFDPAIGPVMELWKTEGLFAKLPSAEEIQARLPLMDSVNIALRAPNGILLAESGMALDLGGIAKGYACDKAVAVLKEGGIEHAILDFGGNVYVVGAKPDGSAWRVGIRLPIIGESGVVCLVEVTDISVVTSGGYERFFEQDGVLYHHLLDPNTGYPARSGLLSATVLADSSADADGFSTACFVLGPEKAARLLAENGLEGVLIGEDMKIYVTDGIRDAVEVMDERFSLE